MAPESTARGRIVMFTHDRQIDRRILLEAEALDADGWEVRILAMGAPESALQDDPRVERVGPSREKPGAGANSILLKGYAILKRFIPVNSGLMRLGRSIGWSLARGGPGALFTEVFARAIADHPAEVYVAHDLPMLPVGVAAVERHGGHLVYDSHECFPEQEFNALERRVWRRLEKGLIGRCDLVITVNASIARLMEERYDLPVVQVVHNAERLLATLPAEKRLHRQLGLPSGARVVLFQGGLSAGRNLDALVSMVPLLRSTRVHLVFLGDGLLRGRLAGLARRLKVADRVHLVPAVPQAELLACTLSADVGIIPYRPNCLNNRLCTPNKLFEFIAAGVPVVASDLPELRRFVEGYGIGLVGDTGTAAGLAELVDACFEDPEVMEGFRAAVARARNEINWEVEGRTLVGLYRRFGPQEAPRLQQDLTQVDETDPRETHVG